MKLLCAIALLSGLLLSAQDWRPLFNGKNLDGWEVRGDGIWTQMKDGTLIGQRPHPAGNPFGDGTRPPVAGESLCRVSA
jgi:hypothetical protein